MLVDIGVPVLGWLLSLEGRLNGDSDTTCLDGIRSTRKAWSKLSTKSSMICKTNKKVIENLRQL